MKQIAIIRNQDIAPETPITPPDTYPYREAVRVVVFKERQVALLYASKDKSYKLPGGGIEANETRSHALRREVMEEIGYEISNVEDIGETLEYKDYKPERQRSFCFVATATGEAHTPQLTEQEKALGMKTVWAGSLEEAITLMEEARPVTMNARFIRHRDLLILKTALRKPYA